MICDIILTPKNNQYIARVKEWPEIIVEGNTRDEVIHQVKSRLSEYLTNRSEVIRIEVPVPEKSENPWLDKFGMFQNDPTFDDWQAEIAAYRDEINRSGEHSR